MSPWTRALWLCWLLWLPLGAGAVGVTPDDPEALDYDEVEYIPQLEDVISEIRFAGNRTTRPEILRQEMVVQVGDIADADRIEQSRQAIMDLGLFKSVRAELLPGSQGTALLITVSEKYYILPVPKLNRNAEGDISYGMELRIDNLAGRNQLLKLIYETEQLADRGTEPIHTASVEYSYPRIVGGAYSLDVAVERSTTVVDAPDGSIGAATYFRESKSARLSVGRWLDRRGPSRGWRAGGGLAWGARSYDYLSGAPGLYQDGQTTGVLGFVEFTDVHDYLYSRAGLTYGYTAEVGVPGLGSETAYTRQEFYYRQYTPVSDRRHRSVETQIKLGVSSGQGLDSEMFGLGGSRNLRGYERGSVIGNAYVLGTIQYLHPLFDHYRWRAAVFVDVGNAYPGGGELHVTELRSAAGLGLRYKVKSFVKLDLRVDAVYAFETGDTRVYAATKEVF